MKPPRKIPPAAGRRPGMEDPPSEDPRPQGLEPALDSLRRHREGIEEVFARYGVPAEVAPGLLSEALLAIGTGVGGAPLQGARLLRAAELVSARWAEDRAENRDEDRDEDQAGGRAGGPDRGAAPAGARAARIDFSEIIRSVGRRLDARRRHLERERRSAVELVNELLTAMPRERQRLSEDPRFHSWAVADRLLDAARQRCPNQPAEAMDLARLTGRIGDHLREDFYGAPVLRDLGARVEMSLANAHRVQRRFAAADEGFEAAEAQLDEGTLDPRLRAELMRLRSALRRNQGRLTEAEELLNRALAIYRWIGEDHEVGRAKLSQALIHDQRGESEEALRLISESLELLDTEKDPRIPLVALQNMGSQYNRLGRHEEAARLLPLMRELCDSDGGPLDRLRVDWLDGAVALASGDASGEATLLAVRRRFMDLGMALDAAVISMDIVANYLVQGRIADTRRITDEIVTILSSLPTQRKGFSREAMAALLAFQQAARMETASLALVRQAHDALRRSQKGIGSEEPAADNAY